MNDDIVTRLREWARGADEQGVSEVVLGLNAAADEIERLRAELVSRADELAQVTAEREEARREICERIAAYAPSMSAEQLARERDWDCFKEDGK